MKTICKLSTYINLTTCIILSFLASCDTEVDPKLLPILTTTEVVRITEATAYSGGNVTSDGGSDVTSRGVCWSESANPTIEHKRTIDAAGTGMFESRITGLNPGTTYYIRAYAANKKGVAYGLQIVLKTKTLTINSTPISAVKINSASSGGTIETDGDSLNVTERGVCWSTTSNPTIKNNKIANGKGKGKYICSLTDLQIATQYYVRAYATNESGTYYGDEFSFITTNGSMTLSTTAATSITAISATIGGSVPGDGGATVTERGFCFGKLPNPTINSKIVNGSGVGSFATNITGLEANTTYYVRAYATNNVGTSYGNEISFTTLNGIINLTTSAASSITATSVTIGGSITTDGGATITARGFCWSKTKNPTTADGKSISTGTIGSYATNISGLSIGSTYYVRSYATNSVGTYYGNEVSFTTQNGVISLTTTTGFSITALTAISGGNVTSDGGGVSVTDRGVCWNTAPNPTLENNKIQTGTGTGVFTSSITNLSASTTYYVRAYATNSVGTVYGNEVSFTTQNGIITLSTSNISSITSFTSKSGGTILTDGGAPITAGGVCWSTNSNPTISNYKTNDATGIGSFTSSISGLTLGVTYYVRAYATNAVDTYYGNELVFKTALAIGDNHQGGKIAYFFKSGDVGFVEGETHGIIAALNDQSTGISWNIGSNFPLTNAIGTAIGTGKTNTDIIVGVQGEGSYAAKLCSDLVLNGYSDWYLPSKDELNQLYINKASIGGFASKEYWSSSENIYATAWLQYFSNGDQSGGGGRIKSNLYNVRAIRSF